MFKPGQSDVQFEVMAPVHNLRLRFFNASFISRPVMDCKSTTEIPVSRWIHVGFSIDASGNSTLWYSGVPGQSQTSHAQ